MAPHKRRFCSKTEVSNKRLQKLKLTFGCCQAMAALFPQSTFEASLSNGRSWDNLHFAGAHRYAAGLWSPQAGDRGPL